VTQESLALYRKLVEHPTARYRSVALNVYAILLHKGARTSAEKLQIVQVLDVMSFVVPLEKNTRLSGRKPVDLDDDEISFRASLGKVLAAYGTETLKMSEDVSSLLSPTLMTLLTDIRRQETADPSLRAQTEKMCYETLPMLLKFVEDNNNDVYDAISPLLSDIMRIVSSGRVMVVNLLLTETRSCGLSTKRLERPTKRATYCLRIELSFSPRYWRRSSARCSGLKTRNGTLLTQTKRKMRITRPSLSDAW